MIANTFRSWACDSHTLEPLESRRMLSADMVLEWDRIMCDAIATDHGVNAPHIQGGPTRTARAMGIESAAVFDAANTIDGSYTPYLVKDVKASKGASIEAAIA